MRPCTLTEWCTRITGRHYHTNDPYLCLLINSCCCTKTQRQPHKFPAAPQKGKNIFVAVCISFPNSLEFRQLAAVQTVTPKIEKLCWSRSCRYEAFIDWMIPLTKPTKMSGQSSCAVIALISRWSQTQLQPTAFSAGVEPPTYHNPPPTNAAYNLTVSGPSHWTLPKSTKSIKRKTLLINEQ